jgi:hypothetical protein
VRDGPVDHYFCEYDCYALWLRYRYNLLIGPILKMNSMQRQEFLGGVSIEQFISDLVVNADPKGRLGSAGVCHVPCGEVPVQADTRMPSS